MTARMLAWRQPPFKKCVTAYWPRNLAPKMIRGSREIPKMEIPPQAEMVGEHSVCSEVCAVKPGGADRREYAGMSSVRR